MRNCSSCQLQTIHPSKPAGLLQPLDVPSYAWHTMTTDYITGLPLTPKGNNATAVFVDKLTMYEYAVPCSDQSDAADWANMYVQHVVQHEGLSLSSSLTEVLSLAVSSTKLLLFACASNGICPLQVTLRLMARLSVRTESWQVSKDSFGHCHSSQASH